MSSEKLYTVSPSSLPSKIPSDAPSMEAIKSTMLPSNPPSTNIKLGATAPTARPIQLKLNNPTAAPIATANEVAVDNRTDASAIPIENLVSANKEPTGNNSLYIIIGTIIALIISMILLVLIYCRRRFNSPLRVKHHVPQHSFIHSVSAVDFTTNDDSEHIQSEADEVVANGGDVEMNDLNVTNANSINRSAEFKAVDSVHILDTRKATIVSCGTNKSIDDALTTANQPTPRGRVISMQSEDVEELFKPGPSTEGDLETVNDELTKWLKDVVELPQYYDTFKQNGLEELSFISKLESIDDLQHIGITMKGHQRIIMNAIRRLNAIPDKCDSVKTQYL